MSATVSCTARLLNWLPATALMLSATATAQEAPGGFIESYNNDRNSPILSQSEIQSFLPERGEFTFPEPWNTEGIRLTNASDCGGADCVHYVGYSYWRNINNHQGQDSMLIFLGLDRPTLFEYNKVTGEVAKLGPLFDDSSGLSGGTTEGWYFSATMPTKMYINNGSRMLRYDVISGETETVVDLDNEFDDGHYIWQMHSSDDDRVHSATVRASGGETQGCMA
jgi:hypothetical protein